MCFLPSPRRHRSRVDIQRAVSSAVQNNDALWFYLVSDESPSKVQYRCHVTDMPLSSMEKYTQQCWLFCVSERNQLNAKMAAACWTGLGRSALQPWISTMLMFHHLILHVIHIRHLMFHVFILCKHWIILLQSLLTVWTRKKRSNFTHGSHVGQTQTSELFSWAAINTIEENDS